VANLFLAIKLKNIFQKKEIDHMNMIEKIMKNEKKCKRFFGLSQQQIENLVQRLQPLWDEAEQKRLSRSDRQRRIGGGRQYQPGALHEMLLVCLLYYKLYLTQEFTGVLFSIDQSKVSRITSNLSAIISKAADSELEIFFQKSERIKTQRIKNFVELQQVCPDIADVITDASETPCNRPKDKDIQKKFYSGKQKTHTLKTQITINTNKRVINVSNSYPGSVHDKKVFDTEGTAKKVPPQARHVLDKGYDGVDKENPYSNICIPFKRKRGQDKLCDLAKQVNKFLSKHRIIVEHVIGKIKNFKICAYTYRGRRENFNQIFKNVAAIYNFSNAAA
jgi:DDE superfamily endonuclease/Helix-turn-helix of DDE superfamily endonuclease